MTTRIGDAAQSARIAALLRDTQGRVRDSQVAASTGKVATSYAKIPDTAGLLVRTRDLHAQTEGMLEQAKQVADRLNAMDGALGAIGSVAERMRALLVNRLDGATGSSVPLAVESDAALGEIAAQLNLRVDGRYLFAGSRTDAPAVAMPDPPPTTTDPSLYYRGDDVVLSLRTAADTEVAYGMTAADGSFAQLISAIGRAGEAHATGDRGALESALSDLGSAIDGVAELRGTLGARAARVEGVIEQQQGTLLYLDETRSRIEDVDLAATLTRLAEDQAMLEASYLVVSRLSGLSLAEYLR